MYIVNGSQRRISIEGYARTLYENYRARVLASKTTSYVPSWNDASPFVKNEFRQEARQLLN